MWIFCNKAAAAKYWENGQIKAFYFWYQELKEECRNRLKGEITEVWGEEGMLDDETRTELKLYPSWCSFISSFSHTVFRLFITTRRTRNLFSLHVHTQQETNKKSYANVYRPASPTGTNETRLCVIILRIGLSGSDCAMYLVIAMATVNSVPVFGNPWFCRLWVVMCWLKYQSW